MRCPKCNMENHDAASFCSECGAAFQAAAPKPESRTSEKNPLPMILIILLLLAVLAAVLIPKILVLLNDPPNRPRVSRVKSDLRTMATGLEAYCVDEGAYPTLWDDADLSRMNDCLYWLTTPISYLTSLPRDAHNPDHASTNYLGPLPFSYNYYATKKSWMLWSSGPDRDYDMTYSYL